MIVKLLIALRSLFKELASKVAIFTSIKHDRYGGKQKAKTGCRSNSGSHQ